VSKKLTEAPGTKPDTFLDFPFQPELDNLDADIAILGIPFGMPYESGSVANDQSNAPDALRQASSKSDIAYTRNHFDWDLGGQLLDGRNIKVVDCGNVTADKADHKEHYRRAEQAARKVFAANSTLITLGGDHGVPIPVLRALEVFGKPITLVHVDAHLDWRHEVNGETEGYSSPIRRAAEMPWIKKIVQIGMRGIGSARDAEVQDAIDYGADIIDAYEMHNIGMAEVLRTWPDKKRARSWHGPGRNRANTRCRQHNDGLCRATDLQFHWRCGSCRILRKIKSLQNTKRLCVQKLVVPVHFENRSGSVLASFTAQPGWQSLGLVTTYGQMPPMQTL